MVIFFVLGAQYFCINAGTSGVLAVANVLACWIYVLIFSRELELGCAR